jgi:hypothetical protein
MKLYIQELSDKVLVIQADNELGDSEQIDLQEEFEENGFTTIWLFLSKEEIYGKRKRWSRS